MPQRNVATHYTFEQQRQEINLLASDFWTQKATVDNAAGTYLKSDGSVATSAALTLGGGLNVPSAFSISSNGGAGTVTIDGNFVVNGTTTTINSTTLTVDDKVIKLGDVATPSNSTANGGGIVLEAGATDHTFLYSSTDSAWVGSIKLKSAVGFEGPILTASQSNITEIGTLSSLKIINTSTAQATLGYDNTKYVQIGRNSSGDYEFISQEQGANLILGTSDATDGAGVERLQINRYGAVLLNGADSFHADADDFCIKERGGGNVGITLQNTANGFGVLYFADAQSSVIGRIQYDHANDTLDLFAAGTEVANFGAGVVNVVGTLAATTLTGALTTTDACQTGDLTILNGNPEIKLKDDNHAGNNTEHLIAFQDSSGNNQMNIGSPFGEQHLRIKHGTTDLVKIQTDGKVGIGDDSPASLLSLKASNPTIRFTDGSTLVASIEGDTTANVFYGFNGADIIFSTDSATAYAPRLQIHSDGQITIGNDHSGADSWDGDLIVANNNGGRITVGDTGSGEKFSIAANGDINLYSYLNGDHINFWTTDGSGTANRFKIKSDGDVEMGGIFEAGRVDCNGLFHIQYGNATNTNYMSSFSNSNGIMHLFRGDGLYIGDNMNTSNQAGGPNLSKIRLKTDGVIECDSTISDSKGNLRRIPRKEPTSGTSYTLVADDSGRVITHGATVVMAANGTFTHGDAITIYNYSASAITIDASTNSALLHWTDGTTAATGDRTLAARGVATLLCVEGTNNTWVITGSLT